jgi:N utilization substance protein B
MSYKKRLQARIYAIQMAFVSYISGDGIENICRKEWLLYQNVDEDTKVFAENLFKVTYNHLETIDDYIKKHLKETWPFQRIGVVEISILRIAIGEFLYFDTPFYAILNDFVNIASKYTDLQATSFINALLDKVKSEVRIVDD